MSYYSKTTRPPKTNCETRKAHNRHPAAYDGTSSIVGSMGLTAGFPRQFQYEEFPTHPLNAREDLANYYINDEACIPQNSQKVPMVGNYEFIKDDPFSPMTDEKINRRLGIFGFALLTAAGLLYANPR